MPARPLLPSALGLLLATSSACGGYGGSGGTGGSGGEAAPPGLPCDQPFAMGQIPGCLIEHGGLQIKFFPLPEGRRAARLAVYLHGDTAWEWFGNAAFTEVVPWAQEHDILVLAPLSPVGYREGSHDYGAAAETRTAVVVGAAIEDFIDAYGTRSDDLLFWSVSGGSWFTTSSFIPMMGGEIQGLFAISCGASQWWADYAWNETAASPRKRFHLFFNYGSLDFLAPNVTATREHYRDFDVEETVYPNATHCAHPIPQPTIEFWEKHLQ